MVQEPSLVGEVMGLIKDGVHPWSKNFLEVMGKWYSPKIHTIFMTQTIPSIVRYMQKDDLHLCVRTLFNRHGEGTTKDWNHSLKKKNHNKYFHYSSSKYYISLKINSMRLSVLLASPNSKPSPIIYTSHDEHLHGTVLAKLYKCFLKTFKQ